MSLDPAGFVAPDPTNMPWGTNFYFGGTLRTPIAPNNPNYKFVAPYQIRLASGSSSTYSSILYNGSVYAHGPCNCWSFGPGAPCTGSPGAAIPNVAPGPYKLGVFLQGALQYSLPIFVTKKDVVDLDAKTFVLDQAALAAGGPPVPVMMQVVNYGSKPAHNLRVEIHMSDDATVNMSDPVVADEILMGPNGASIFGGATENFQFWWMLPESLTPDGPPLTGKKYFSALVYSATEDDDNLASNWGPKINVTFKPDLKVSSLVWSAPAASAGSGVPELFPGQTFCISSVTVENIGNTPSEPTSMLRLYAGATSGATTGTYLTAEAALGLMPAKAGPVSVTSFQNFPFYPFSQGQIGKNFWVFAKAEEAGTEKSTANNVSNKVKVKLTEKKFEVRYRTFIPCETVAVPLPWLQGSLPYFDGDNKNVFAYSSTSFRSDQSCQISLNKNYVGFLAAAVTRFFGPSKGYAASKIYLKYPSGQFPGPNPMVCSYGKISGVAPDSTLPEPNTPDKIDIVLSETGGMGPLFTKVAKAHFHLAGKNPLVAFAPAIDVEADFELGMSPCGSLSWRFSGAHDGFPAHEFYFNGSGSVAPQYKYNPVDTGEDPWALGGGLDVQISVPWTVIP